MAERSDGTTWKGAYDVWQCTAEKAKKRCDRYLAKYVSKGSNFTGKDCYFPTRWYGVSRNLHNKLKDSIRYFPAGNEEKQGAWELTEECLQQLIELGKMAYKQFSFVDKVGSGSTFVFYFSDLVLKDEFRKFMGRLKMKFMKKEAPIMETKKVSTHHLLEVGKRPYLLERFLNDMGLYYQNIYEDWVKGIEVPDSELFWLNRYAFDLLWRVGLASQSQPPFIVFVIAGHEPKLFD